MARPQKLAQSGATGGAGTTGGGGLQYPSDLEGVSPYRMEFRFRRYSRPAGSTTATYPLVGNPISMPLPTNISEGYSIRQNSRDLGLWAAPGELLEQGTAFVNKGADSIVSGIKGFQELLGGGSGPSALPTFRRDIEDFGKYAMVFTPNLFQDVDVLNAASRYFGIIKNPHATLIFDGVELRTHQFEWLCSPRNESEAVVLNTIINEFRRHAHPAFSQGFGSLALDYPDYVYANFIGTDYLYPVKLSGIKNIHVDRTASGQGPQFYTGGSPVVTKITLELVEIEILTQGDFGANVSDDGSYAQPGDVDGQNNFQGNN